MSCQTVRERLLASECPDQPATEQARHLAGCADCRVWLRRLALLEQQLPLIPVPTSAPPPALLEMLCASPANAIVRTPVLLHPVRPRAEGARQKLALAISLAASLALFAIGWWAWPHLQTPVASSRKPSPTKREIIDALLAPRFEQAQTPRERVTVVEKLADQFFGDAREHPEDPTRVEGSAQRFCMLMQDDLPRFAREVPGPDRAELKDVVGRLGEIESEASRLAAEWRGKHAASARSLEQIAAAAREAQSRLRELVQA